MFTKLIQLSGVIFIIFLIGEVSAYGQSNYQPNPYRQERGGQMLPYEPEHPEIPRITAFEAMEFYKQGKLILANAHESESHQYKHILGAISLPNDKSKIMNVKLPRNIIIAFYCE